MFDSFFFFTYIIAGFIGFLAILLAALLKKYWAFGNKQLLAAIRNFMICTAFIDAMYFYLNYDFLKTGCYTTTAVPRVLDSFTYIGQVYFWAAYIREKCQLSPKQRKPMAVISLCLCGFCLVTNLLSYGFFMDDYYFVSPGTLRVISIVIEILLMFCLTFITVWHLVKGLAELVQRKIRTLVTLISILISVNGLWNAALSLTLMTGALAPPDDMAMDPTGFLLLLINLFTVLLIYQEDFFALFHIETDEAEEAEPAAVERKFSEMDPGKSGEGRRVEKQIKGEGQKTTEAFSPLPETVEESFDAIRNDVRNIEETPVGKDDGTVMENRMKSRLDFIAQSHSLTRREREVLSLAYQGMTNPEIADELIISRYTVKRHMHNIFEKLDISTRMELVHLINSENGPPGPL